MKNQADYSKYECPFSHVKKDCGHELKGPEGFEGTYSVWCPCGFRGPVFCLDPEELKLESKPNHKDKVIAKCGSCDRPLAMCECLDEDGNSIIKKDSQSIPNPSSDATSDRSDKIYTVYEGSRNNKILYIGTTTQLPADRFRWHRNNGKKLFFRVLFRYDNEKEMLEKEFELIKKYNPELNKIKHRKQNLNIKLSESELKSRTGSSEWCQNCFKRRVNPGYGFCLWCS